MKSNIIEDFNLPKYVKGKSFAEASKAISKKFEGRGSSEVKKTKEELLARLAKAQEYVKMQEQTADGAQQPIQGGQDPSAMMGKMPQGNQMALGGRAPIKGVNSLDSQGAAIGANPITANTPDLMRKAVAKNTPLTEVDTASINNSTGLDFTTGEANGLFERVGATPRRTNPQIDFGKYGDAGYFKQGNTVGNNKVSVHTTDKNPHNADTVKQLLPYLQERNPGLELDMQYTPRGQNQMSGGGRPTVQGVNSLTPQGAVMGNTQITADTSGLMKNASGTPGGGAARLAGGIAGGLGTALDFGNELFGDTGVDTSGNAGRQQEEDVAMGALGGVAKGAKAGAALGPWGAAIGGAIGGVSGLIGGNKANKKIHEGNMNASRIENNQFTNDFAGGGRAPVKTVNELTHQGRPEDIGLLKNAPQERPNFNIKSNAGRALSSTGSFLKDNYSDILRTTPALTNAMQLASIEKPDAVKLNRMDARYKPGYVDERVLENKVQNESNNTTRALAGASNGSMGALRSNLLGSQLMKTNALSDAYMKADAANKQQDAIAQRFNQRQDMTNLRQGTVEQQMNDQNEGAYNTAKSALTSQIGTDIGNFGKERTNMKQVAAAFGYTWDGKYMRDKEGNVVNPSLLAQKTEGKKKTEKAKKKKEG